jgi:hypothetical protein
MATDYTRPTQDEYEARAAHEYGEHGDGPMLYCQTHKTYELTDEFTREPSLEAVRGEVQALISVILGEQIAFTRHNVVACLQSIVRRIDREMQS